jgi:branched-chain amino acid transport system ATP-binding protein
MNHTINQIAVVTTASPILEIQNLTMDFGGIKALDKLNLNIPDAMISALIGPNGAGKTTLFNCLTGIYQPTDGSLLLAQKNGSKKNLINLKPNEITRQGLARTFQNIRLFKKMTVLENVMIGFHCRTRATVLGALFRNKKTRQEEEEIIHNSYTILQKTGLDTMVNESAENLPYGAQRRLEIARALATGPQLLLLDEPAAGMNPQETNELNHLIRHICSEGIAILLIEHDMKLVMNLSEYIFVMDYGKKIAEGTPLEIQQNQAVIKAYLGEGSEDA